MRKFYHEEATIIIKDNCDTIIYTYKGVYIIRATTVKFVPSNSNKIKTLCINREGD